MSESLTVTTTPSGVAYPARSKMLDVYATDIALMLAEGGHDAAEHLALSIPHIAVALADAAMESSCVAYTSWCSKWVVPDFGAAVYDEWCVRTGECMQMAAGVPFAALRALRLRRRAREVRAPHAAGGLSPDVNRLHGVACALLGGQFRWYEQKGRYDPIVQTNLARLGVLR